MIILHRGANVWNSLPWKLLFFPNVIYLWAQRWSQKVSIFFPSFFFSWTIGIRYGETAVCSDLSATGINFHIPLNHKIEAIKASLASHYTSTCRSFIVRQHRSFPSLSSPLLFSSLVTSAYVLVLTGWDLIFDRIPTSLTQIKDSNIWTQNKSVNCEFLRPWWAPNYIKSLNKSQ